MYVHVHTCNLYGLVDIYFLITSILLDYQMQFKLKIHVFKPINIQVNKVYTVHVY